VVFLLIEFPLHQQNICLFNFRIVIFCCTLLHTLGKLEVIFIFHEGSRPPSELILGTKLDPQRLMIGGATCHDFHRHVRISATPARVRQSMVKPGLGELRRAPFVAPLVFRATVPKVTQIALINNTSKTFHLGVIVLISPNLLRRIDKLIEVLNT
jgi:hypothetical protein